MDRVQGVGADGDINTDTWIKISKRYGIIEIIQMRTVMIVS